MPAPTIATDIFRQVLSHVPTPVTVVAGHGTTGPVGMTVGSFFSISLEPAMIGFCVGHNSSSWPLIEQTGGFCVSVLGADQAALCQRFATKAANRFDDVSWTPAPSGAPRLTGSLVWIDCRVSMTRAAGDHDIVVGEVEDLGVEDENAAPLVFHRGGFPRLVVEGGG